MVVAFLLFRVPARASLPHAPARPPAAGAREPVTLSSTRPRPGNINDSLFSFSMSSALVRPAAAAVGAGGRPSRGALQTVCVATPSRPPTSFPAKR